MILTVFTSGWFADSPRFVTVALQENLVVFVKDAEGNFQKLTSAEGLQRDTPVYLELDMFLDLYMLARHFDLMVKESGKQGVCLFLDSKGGGFRQR